MATVEETKKEKVDLELALARILNQFEDAFGVTVKSVYLRRVDCFAVRSTIREVEMTVEL